MREIDDEEGFTSLVNGQDLSGWIGSTDGWTIEDGTLICPADKAELKRLMPALNALMFGTLLYRARLVPRAIPALGLIGAPLQIAFVIAMILLFVPGGAGADYDPEHCRLVGGSLEGRPVTLLVLPGAEETAVTSLTELVEALRALEGRYRLAVVSNEVELLRRRRL